MDRGMKTCILMCALYFASPLVSSQSLTTNGTLAFIDIASNRTVPADSLTLPTWVTSLSIIGSSDSIINSTSSIRYQQFELMLKAVLGSIPLSITNVTWLVDCNQLLIFQSSSCSMDKWLQYDVGLGYMRISHYQNQTSSLTLSAFNITCPPSQSLLPPCTAASVSFAAQLAAALVQMQLGPPVTIRLMRNISIPQDGTAAWLAIARSAAAASQYHVNKSSLVFSRGIYVYSNLSLIGQAGSLTELDLGLNLDLILIDDDNRSGFISMTNLVLVNMAVGADQFWPSSLLVGSVWALNFNRKPASQNIYTVLTLTNVIVVVPPDLYSYLATWSARQASPVPQESATADWMLNFVFFSIDIARADKNNLYVKQRVGSGTLWSQSVLTDLPRVSPLLVNSTGVTSLDDNDPFAPFSLFTPVFNSSQLYAQLSNASTAVTVIMSSISMPKLPVRVSKSLSIIGRKTNPVALDFGGFSDLILLSPSTTLKLSYLTLVGLGVGNSSNLDIDDSSSRLLSNLTSGLWAISFPRLSPSILSLVNCQMIVSYSEVLAMQWVAQRALASSGGALSSKLQSVLSNASLNRQSLVTPPASSLLLSLISSNRITITDVQPGLITFGVYNSLGLTGSKITTTSSPPLAPISSYVPRNLTIGYELPSPPPPQEPPRPDGLPSSTIGVIIGSVLGAAALIGLSSVLVIWLLNKRRKAEIDYEMASSQSKAPSVPEYVNVVMDGAERSGGPSSSQAPPSSSRSLPRQQASQSKEVASPIDNAYIVTRAGQMAHLPSEPNNVVASSLDRAQDPAPLLSCRSEPLPTKSAWSIDSSSTSKLSGKKGMMPIPEHREASIVMRPIRAQRTASSFSGSVVSVLQKAPVAALRRDGLAGGSITSDPNDAMEHAVKKHLQALQGNAAASSQPDLMSQVQLENVLGQGSFGIVYKGKWRSMTVAVKSLLFHDASTAKKIRQRALTEAAINQLLSNDNIVNTYAYDLRTLTPDVSLPDSHLEAGTHWKLYIVQEFCDGGTLADWIDNRKLLSPTSSSEKVVVMWEWILQLIVDILKGLVYIHSNQIIHGDLSSGNVLLKSEARSKSSFLAKVSDFGLSRFLSEGQSHISNARQGTPFYIAPEIISRGFISKAADIFSIGVLMREMAVGLCPPWRSDRDDATSPSPRIIRDPSRPPAPHENELHPMTFDYRIPGDIDCPRGYREVAHACLSLDHKKRPRAEDTLKLMTIINSTYLSKLSSDQLQMKATVPAGASSSTTANLGAVASKTPSSRAKNVGYL